MSDTLIARRLFIHVGGYDPMTPEAAFRRFARELRRFETAWGATACADGFASDTDFAGWDVQAAGPNWAVRTEVRLVRWDDIMAAAGRVPRWRRVPDGLLAFADFALGGALWGYLRRAWRYALFFLYPVVLLAGLAGLAVAMGTLLARVSGSGTAGAVAGVLAGLALIAWAGRALLLDHLMDDWIFSRRYVRHPDENLSGRLDRVAADVVGAARDGGFDEVVVLGHSLGAVLAVDLLDRALAAAPDLGQGRTRLALVTVGSSIPKIGLHRAAGRLRDALGRVADAPGLFWVEYQALIDAMNFYKTDPVVHLGAGPRGPLLRVARISRMLNRDYYRRIGRNFFRIHNQFVSGNDLRASYDYFMLACGPLPVAVQAEPRSGAVERFGPDGALRPASGSPAAAPGEDAP